MSALRRANVNASCLWCLCVCHMCRKSCGVLARQTRCFFSEQYFQNNYELLMLMLSPINKFSFFIFIATCAALKRILWILLGSNVGQSHWFPHCMCQQSACNKCRWSVVSEYRVIRLWRLLFFFFYIHSLSPVCRTLYGSALHWINWNCFLFLSFTVHRNESIRR